jgi:phage gpG-like protein
VAARIARVHQFGLRDKVNSSGAMATYPRRELLGLSKADRMAIARQVIDSLGCADGNCRADSPAGEHRAPAR